MLTSPFKVVDVSWRVLWCWCVGAPSTKPFSTIAPSKCLSSRRSLSTSARLYRQTFYNTTIKTSSLWNIRWESWRLVNIEAMIVSTGWLMHVLTIPVHLLRPKSRFQSLSSNIIAAGCSGSHPFSWWINDHRIFDASSHQHCSSSTCLSIISLSHLLSS